MLDQLVALLGILADNRAGPVINRLSATLLDEFIALLRPALQLLRESPSAYTLSWTSRNVDVLDALGLSVNLAPGIVAINNENSSSDPSSRPLTVAEGEQANKQVDPAEQKNRRSKERRERIGRPQEDDIINGEGSRVSDCFILPR